MARRVVFLDRDGTINDDFGFVHRIEDWRFLPRAPEAIRMLRDAGFAVVVVTNQSAIADGWYSEGAVEQLHAFVRRLLSQWNTTIDAFAYCPHARSGQCDCRKPMTGMAQQIEAMLGTSIDYRRSWTIGDRPSDVQFGQSLGTATALIRSRYWSDHELPCRPDWIGDSLPEAASWILQQSGSGSCGSCES